MITLGIDLASQAKSTAICEIRWDAERAVVQEICGHQADPALDARIETSDVVGIDAPFGWPRAFVTGVGDWSHCEWTDNLRDRLRFRLTDYKAREFVGRWPLSVSTDLIALPAMRAMALLQRHQIMDRSGKGGRFFEVYPAASLHAWGMPSRGYKGRKAVAATVRREVLAQLQRALPWLEGTEACAGDDHFLDALVASLSARAAAQGRTIKPSSEQEVIARAEGWIHLPTRLPDLPRKTSPA